MAGKKSKPPENSTPTSGNAAPASEKPHKEYFCSFCRKSSNNAYRMIAGPDDIFICDECINVCVKIMLQETGAALWIPVTSKHSVFSEYLGTKRDFPPVNILERAWNIAYLAPHNKEFDALYSAHIAPLTAQNSLEIIRLPPVYGKQKSIRGIMKNVYEAVILIADVSGKDPDVLYVLGMAHLIGKPLVILSQNPADIPIDLKKDRQIIYENTAEGLKTIGYHLSHIFEFLSHEKKADAVLPYGDKLPDPMNYPDPPKPKQKRKS
jgi:hypothetical protein